MVGLAETAVTSKSGDIPLVKDTPAKSGSKIGMEVSSDLVKTQTKAEFTRPQSAQSSVMGLLRDCQNLSIKPEDQKILDAIIDQLASKVEAVSRYRAEGVKQFIAARMAEPQAVKKLPVLEEEKEIESDDDSDKLSFVEGDDKEISVPKKTEQLGFFGSVRSTIGSILGSTLGSNPRAQGVRQAIEEVGTQEGFKGQLGDIKGDLVATREQEALETAEAQRLKEIEQALNEHIDFFKTLKEVPDIKNAIVQLGRDIKGLKGYVESEKREIVRSLRDAEINNRAQGKFLREEAAMRSAANAFRATETSEEYSPAELRMIGRGADQLRRRVGERKKQEMLANGYKNIKSQYDVFAEADRLRVDPTLTGLDRLVMVLDAQVEALIHAEVEKRNNFQTAYTNAIKEGDREVAATSKNGFDDANQRIKDLLAERGELPALQKGMQVIHADMDAIQQLEMQVRVGSDNKADLPFSLAMIGNNDDLPDSAKNWSLHEALRYGETGGSNHVFPRALALRNTLAEFGAGYNLFLRDKHTSHSAVRGDTLTSLSELSGKLEAGDEKSVSDVLGFLSTKGVTEGAATLNAKDDGRKFIHLLAANNISAAGFNAITLKHDAPSLSHKVQSGLSAGKLFSPIGRERKYARHPAEQIGIRLSLLTQLSAVLQNELFRNGKPVDMTHAVQTPHHALEASSMLLASIPNDLLVTKNKAVTDFMLAVKGLEAQIKEATPEEPVSLDTFKGTFEAFHKDVGNWITERNKIGIHESVALSGEISKMASEPRKGVLMRVSTAIGHFLNPVGGRYGWKEFSELRAQGKRNARMVQLLKQPEYRDDVAKLKRRLDGVKKANESVPADNVGSLLRYLEGKTRDVELNEPLTSEFVKVLEEAGDLFKKAWNEQPSSDKMLLADKVPGVVKLTAAQISQIRGFGESNLSAFVIAKPSQPVLSSAAPVFVGGDLSRSSSVTGSTGGGGGRLSRSFSVDRPTGPDLAPPLSNDGWVLSMWNNVMSRTDNPAQTPLENIQLKFRNVLLSNNPSASPEDIRAQDEALAAIHRDREAPGSDVLARMKSLTPALINIERGDGVRKQLSTFETRNMQNVSGSQNRCWLRSAWGSAVNALGKDDFVERIVDVSARGFTKVEASTIYEEMKRRPLDGVRDYRGGLLETKQRALMIQLTSRYMESLAADEGTDVRATLERLKNGNNPQAEQEFGVTFLNAMGLPAVIHKNSGTVPDIYLPSDYSVDSHGHPDSWPALYYSGSGDSGHWQFLKPKAASTEASAA